jgi:hypothetical protein
MKKLIALLSVFVMVGCTNPSMEDGLEKMDKALAELAAAIESLNIGQMEADLAQMNSDVAQMIVDLEAQQGVWDDAIAQIAAIGGMLDGILADSENWATTEQMQGLLEDVQKFGEGIDVLVLQADYDYDGVINAIDKCPNTPLSEISNVNAQGCASGETPVTD